MGKNTRLQRAYWYDRAAGCLPQLPPTPCFRARWLLLGEFHSEPVPFFHDASHELPHAPPCEPFWAKRPCKPRCHRAHWPQTVSTYCNLHCTQCRTRKMESAHSFQAAKLRRRPARARAASSICNTCAKCPRMDTALSFHVSLPHAARSRCSRSFCRALLASKMAFSEPRDGLARASGGSMTESSMRQDPRPLLLNAESLHASTQERRQLWNTDATTARLQVLTDFITSKAPGREAAARRSGSGASCTRPRSASDATHRHAPTARLHLRRAVELMPSNAGSWYARLRSARKRSCLLVARCHASSTDQASSWSLPAEEDSRGDRSTHCSEAHGL